MISKRTLFAGATIAAVTAGGLGVVGLASAATTNGTTGGSSIVDKLATKFNLNKSDVQAVFDEDRQAMDTQREAEQTQKLADAVKAGTLTQAQADHITAAQKELKTLRGTTNPKDQTDSVKQQVKAKMDELRQWAKDNSIDMQYVMGGRGGHGGSGMMQGRDGASENKGASSSTTN